VYVNDVSDATQPYKGFPGQPRYNFFGEQFTEIEKYKMGRVPLPDTLWEASSPAEGGDEGYDVV